MTAEAAARSGLGLGLGAHRAANRALAAAGGHRGFPPRAALGRRRLLRADDGFAAQDRLHFVAGQGFVFEQRLGQGFKVLAALVQYLARLGLVSAAALG